MVPTSCAPRTPTSATRICRAQKNSPRSWSPKSIHPTSSSIGTSPTRLKRRRRRRRRLTRRPRKTRATPSPNPIRTESYRRRSTTTANPKAKRARTSSRWRKSTSTKPPTLTTRRWRCPSKRLKRTTSRTLTSMKRPTKNSSDPSAKKKASKTIVSTSTRWLKRTVNRPVTCSPSRRNENARRRPRRSRRSNAPFKRDRRTRTTLPSKTLRAVACLPPRTITPT